MSICICIPKVESNVTKHYIINAFKQFNIGHIFRINLVNSKEKKNKLAFVYIKNLNDNSNTKTILKSMEENIDFKVMHDFPNFWKCYKAND